MLNNCFIKAGKSAAGFYVLKNLLMRILKLVYFGLLCFILSASVVACSDDNPVSGGTEVPPETDNNGDGDNNPDTDNTLEEYPAPDRSAIAAFPGAYGAGRFTTGGAGGKVYVVTSLADTNEKGLCVTVSAKAERVRLCLQ